MLETPPLTRRKLVPPFFFLNLARNTSAHAKKKPSTCLTQCRTKKHLRLCGENISLSRFGMFWKETPPLTRRKRIHILTMRRRHRNTSACVEKTNYILNLAIFSKKHLRAFILSPEIWETPPRTRRKRAARGDGALNGRNTSAYAEKTERMLSWITSSWKHLRVRGENLRRNQRRLRN